MRFVKGIISGLCLLGLTAGLISCGTTTNNDQGVSFTLTGFYSPTELNTGLASISVPLSDNSSLDGAVNDAAFAALEVFNNLTGQSIRAERVYISYYVQAANVQPPSTTAPLSFVLGPSSNNGTSFPSSPGGTLPTSVKSVFAILPSEIRSYLSLNRDLYPEPPYLIEARVKVRGITSAGAVIETNELGFPIYVVTDQPIPTSTPEATGGATFENGSSAP